MTETKEQAEKNTIDVPEGMDVSGIDIYCKKHGKITDVVQTLALTKLEPDGKQKPSITYICPGCLAELYQHFQKEGLCGDIMIVPQFKPTNATEVEVKEDEKSPHADNEGKKE